MLTSLFTCDTSDTHAFTPPHATEQYQHDTDTCFVVANDNFDSYSVNEAERFCLDLGGHAATFQNAYERDSVISL